MRISDDRYSRDRLRLDIAMHFIRHEARTHTIRQWTGLTDDRIRKLYRSYLLVGGGPLARHRGKSPQQAAYFLRTVGLRQESAVFAAICCLLGLLEPRPDGQTASPPGGVSRAAALCQAYEVYRAAVPAPAIGFEHAVLLVNALIRGTELRLRTCCRCHALVVADSVALRPPHCTVCAAGHSEGLAPV